MPADIFSTYSTGENRVTASIIAVLRSLTIDRTERLIAALTREPDFELVRFDNQVGGGGPGVPDAIVSSSLRLLIETKIKPNSVQLSQFERHIEKLAQGNEAERLLLVLTPDTQKPRAIDALECRTVYWASFNDFDQAIEEELSSRQEVISEREAFLLRELQSLFVREKLLPSDSEVVVVAARDAWPEYERYHAYVCQADRSFQAVRNMGFYASGMIQPLIPRILDTHPHVDFVPGNNPAKLDELIRKLLDETSRQPGHAYKVMFLSAPDSNETTNLGRPIVNDLTTTTGRTWAFTLSQRYVSLERLMQARTTRDLIAE